ncbi:uncharacterized protein Z518_05328 [Rhinocladiella mackenziei CBS 650.93]|uniref:GATA-type domain-containing protein n=1 Tax=Rhinocladiella mackenziei CBS 650.93 TaxID=1442369 RepID=A0A0D2J5Y7_9EURO|nr:uncharacterized protein Z518_05328 [Rhinocladiella mackenziei CBS 650.93]KIX04460.1 hypothetical protein Z518_05328 [Rhinocladiella mackenziei CBS 650.93]
MATSPGNGVSIRTIRLKVLYTFDAEQKDNHLARWPQPLEVQTAFVDDVNQIGLIDLRTCLEAVTTASPELTTGLENDYTVYAYDYSEPDTPLVGQGMLSKALANQSQCTGNENEAMVTGRVSKNVMGLFSKSTQETLEVKLRFTPVNTFPPRYRSGSVSSQDGIRPQWNTSSVSQSLPRSASPVDTAALESMQRMLNGENMQISGPGGRPGTPNDSQSFNGPARQSGNRSRPSSRAGTRQMSHGRRDSFNSGYYSGDENVEDGPARKRAKTTKVDWPTKANFNIERQPESLRVAASTASSVRLHRPIAINPAAALQPGISIEEPVRPPTPIPASNSGKPKGRPGRKRKNPPSNLVRGSQVRESSPITDSAPQPEHLNVSVTSPEDTRVRSVSSTPANIPSSPPVMPEHQHSAVTSPALPPLMDTGHDSGFMSGDLDDLFGNDQLLHFDDFIVDKPEDLQGGETGRDQQLADTSNLYPPVFDEGNDVEEPVAQSKSQMVPPPLPASSRALPRAQSYTPAPRVSMSSPRLAPAPIPRARQIMEEQRDQQRNKAIAPAPVPKSDPAPRILQRAQTWGPDSDAILSDVPAMEESRVKAVSKKKVGKEMTKARLENAIANGEMPPFCDNCGSIETPAWRRAYAKVFECDWDDVETSLEQGECCYKEPLEHNPDGTVKTFRGYKAEKRSGDEAEDWISITLCNPCGLWFHKQKCPRPREKWQKKDPKEKGKRKRNSHLSKASKKANGSSNFKDDAQTPASDDSSPDTATEALDPDENENEALNNDDFVADNMEAQLPPMPQAYRASSAEPGPRGLQARTRHRATRRQVQSSPGRANGSEASAREIDLTPKPVRRQLFPSPDRAQVRSDPGPLTTSTSTKLSLPAFVRRSPRLNKTRDVFATAAGAVEITVDGKENVVPAAVVDDGLADSFDGLANVELPPMTPTPKRRSERLLLKTPSKTPQRQFGAEMSPNADITPNFRTPKAKQAPHPALAALLGTVRKDAMALTPFSRSIHDALTSDMVPPMNLTEENKAASRGETQKNTPSKAISFDFPDLPSLKTSSPMSGEQLINFNFSAMTTDQMDSDLIDPFTTNATMPSSPPAGIFGFLDTNDKAMGTMWDGIIDANAAQHHGQSSYPNPEALGVVAPSAQPLRRSPRKRKVK